MKNKKNLLYSLPIMLAALIYVPAKAQQKNGARRVDFSGEWKSKESISMGGNIVCTYIEGDRMLSNTMKIAEQANFLTIEVPKSSVGALNVANVEKLTFDGKTSEINYGKERGKKFKAKLSADGKTMTINSVVYLVVPASYDIKKQSQLVVNVTEIWSLSDDGKYITIQTKAKSNEFGDERSWQTVFEKAG